MADDISNTVLLQHIQAMKSSLETRMSAIEEGTAKLASEVRTGFQEAREHRQALQEDLEATIKMLGKHEQKLARLSS